VAVVALVAVCAAAGASAPVSFDAALSRMRADAVYVPAGGWSRVIAAARARDAGAQTPSAGLRYVVARLRAVGDRHARLFTKEQWQQAFGSQTPTKPPKVSLAAGRVGEIALPPILAAPGSAAARLYARSALVALSSLQTKRRPCGWIVDLRGDQGGDMFPMLLSVEPLLGEGALVAFRSAHGTSPYVTARPGGLAEGIQLSLFDTAPVAVPELAPVPAVALLTGPETASAGEAVAIAFRGRGDVRSFGEPTYGATGSPEYVSLPGGAELAFSSSLDVDRNGVVYRRPLEPRVVTSSPLSSARRWLLSTGGCRS
jgi:C-terminal processing protease CtpA/Prc